MDVCPPRLDTFLWQWGKFGEDLLADVQGFVETWLLVVDVPYLIMKLNRLKLSIDPRCPNPSVIVLHSAMFKTWG